ncbi:MAG: hypothetical protein GC201_02405 [Alphaproteobacteria bacterium]|nr:hypothetical protein [Alphaproteobacteria bacterium]
MQSNNPFGLGEEGGGVHPLHRAASEDAPEPDNPFLLGRTVVEEPVLERLTFGRVDVNLTWGNPLLVSGAALLTLAETLRQKPEEFAGLADIKAAAQRALKAYRTASGRTELDAETVKSGVTVLGALIDDLVLNGPWPGKSEWRQRPMAGPSRDPRGAGQQVIDLLEEVLVDPGRRYYLLELVYVVMALGFEGPFRIDARGPLLLIQYRERLLAAIRAEAEKHPRASVSIGAKGNAHKALAYLNPFTMVLGGVLLVAASLGIAVLIFGEGSPRVAGNTGAAPDASAILSSPDLQPRPEPAPGRIRALLDQDTATRLVSIDETASSVVLNVAAQTLFVRDSAKLDPASDRTMRRIGAAVGLSAGPVYLVAVRSTDGPGLMDEQVRQVADFLKPWTSEQGKQIVCIVMTAPADGKPPVVPGRMLVVIGKQVRPAAPTGPMPVWF